MGADMIGRKWNAPQEGAPSVDAVHDYFNRAYELARNEKERRDALLDHAEFAFDREEFGKAKRLAQAALKHQDIEDGNQGSLIHTAHTILGHIALRRGDEAAARDHLLKSVDMQGSPQLNSLGPHYWLAKKLFSRENLPLILEHYKRRLRSAEDRLKPEIQRCINAIEDYGASMRSKMN